jgi:uncharacterized protein (DUF849 family)
VSDRIKRIKACLNGGRGRDEHPGVPVTPAELAVSAAAAVAAGAEAVHLHARGGDGAESVLAADVGAAVTAVRLACPGTPVGVSTGLWITGGDAGARQAAVAGWADLPGPARPDFASANVSEPGLAELLGALNAAGVAVEAGVWSVADAEALAALGPPAPSLSAPSLSAPSPSGPWLRILVEIMGVPAAGAVAAADEILRRLDELGVTAPRLLHGEEAGCWPLVARAGKLGLPTRIGLEDTITGPDAAAVTSNAELIRLALPIWAAAAL